MIPQRTHKTIRAHMHVRIMRSVSTNTGPMREH